MASKYFVLLLFWLFTAVLSAAENFNKISVQGEELNLDAAQWRCVIDVSTSLMWEVKTRQTGLGFYGDSYTWFDGQNGVENGQFSTHCTKKAFCNTHAYVQAVNEQKLCGFDDWRLPSFNELMTIRHFPDHEPTINQDFFPNTQPHFYWSADRSKDEENVALDVPFFYGGSSGSGMEFNSFVRLVRDVD